MTNTSVPRPDPAAAIVGGLLGGLVVAASLLAFVSVREPRVERDDASLAELRASVAELRVQTAELRTQVAAQAQTDATRQPPPRSEPPPVPEHAVVCGDDQRCTLDRGYVEELLANPAAQMAQLRMMPSVKDGVTRGIKLYGIRPGSLAKLLGFRNGDLVVNINGEPITGADAAVRAYRRVQAADSLAVEIERKGERLVKTCDLR